MLCHGDGHKGPCSVVWRRVVWLGCKTLTFRKEEPASFTFRKEEAHRFGRTFCLHLQNRRVVLPWRWRQHGPPKRRQLFMRLHAALSHETAVFIYSIVFSNFIENCIWGRGLGPARNSGTKNLEIYSTAYFGWKYGMHFCMWSRSRAVNLSRCRVMNT
jgi:hypothetical protein